MTRMCELLQRGLADDPSPAAAWGAAPRTSEDVTQALKLVLYGVTSNDAPERAPSYEDFGDGDTASV